MFFLNSYCTKTLKIVAYVTQNRRIFMTKKERFRGFSKIFRIFCVVYVTFVERPTPVYLGSFLAGKGLRNFAPFLSFAIH